MLNKRWQTTCCTHDMRPSATSVKKNDKLDAREIAMYAIRYLDETLLHLCAMTAIKMKGEFVAYYQKKIAEGKHVLKALNSIKNKLVLRTAAVIKNEMPYDVHYDYKSVAGRLVRILFGTG